MSASTFLGCSSQSLDLVFSLDSSSSVGRENFAQLKKIVSSLSLQFGINRDLTQVGLVVCGKRPHTLFGLDTHMTNSAVFEAINQAPFVGGSSSVGSCLLHIYEDVMTIQKGARPGVKKIVALISSGAGVEDAIVPAQRLRNNDISLLVIGIGHVQTSSLLRIAGSHNNLLQIPSYEDLIKNEELIIARLCNGKKFFLKKTFWVCWYLIIAVNVMGSWCCCTCSYNLSWSVLILIDLPLQKCEMSGQVQNPQGV